MVRSRLSALLLGTVLLGTALPAQAQWRAVNDPNLCAQVIMPSGDNAVMMGLSASGPQMVMVTFASKAMPQLGPGADYRGSMRFDEGEAESVAIVQRPDAETVMVAMALSMEHLDVLARSQRIQVRLDGRRLTEAAPPGRPEAVAALRRCVADLTADAGVVAPAGPARPAGPTTAARGSTEDALAAAIAAGDRASRGGAQAPTAAPQRGSPNGFPQGQADDLLMMMRMNNRLMNNGGNMADPSMGAVMHGLEY
jgi:hypothetical protein